MPALLSFLSVIVPVFNEKESLRPLLEKSLALKGPVASRLEIVLVDDGSEDGSRMLIEELVRIHPEVVAVYHPQNLGIGMALLSGYEKASGDWIALIPADLQFDPADLEKGLSGADEADVLCFYRPQRPDYSFYRQIISQVNRGLNRLLFGLSLRDINWVKIYRRWVIRDISVRSRTPFVESERLIRAWKRGARILEVEAPYYPRQWGKPRGARFRTVVRSINDLLKFVLFSR